MVSELHKNGERTVRNGLGMVWEWYGNGLGLVWEWYGNGMGTVWELCGKGTMLEYKLHYHLCN